MSPVTGAIMISIRSTTGASCIALASTVLGLAVMSDDAAGHGFAGQRFFPATILTDDPFVADEVSLPTITRPPTGLDRSQELGIDFGDLAPELAYLRPFAVTGNLGFDFPTKTESAGTPNPNNFNYGFALEYSLPYLQCCVKDIGLREPFNRLIPLVEVAFTTPITRAEGVQTVGTIQPGIIWSGTYFQIGAEAILPVNKASGRGFGGVVQFHVYLDDLFPRSIGKPISEW
jgi:hypothetical protein